MKNNELSHLNFVKGCAPSPNISNIRYKNVRTPVTAECRIHGEISNHFTAFRSGKGCNVCAKIESPSSKIKLSKDEYIKYADHLHNGKYDYQTLDTNSEKISVVCPIHGEFKIRRSAHISPSQLYGCQKCGHSTSRGESKIKDFLDAHQIKFTTEKIFEWNVAVDKRQPLRYDFYLPDLNTLIEFDGRHHFLPTKYGGQTDKQAEDQFERTKFYDMIKTINAYLSTINLIRISYHHYADIDSILKNELLTENRNILSIYNQLLQGSII